MLSLREHFLELLSNIEPNTDRAALASDLPAKVREFLEDTDKIITVSPHTRLSGSYVRDTVIKNIKDVDILVFVDPEYKDQENSAQTVMNTLVRALDGLPEALGDDAGYIDAELALKRQRRSVLVHVTLDGEEFDMDIVPAILDSNTDKPLDVPDRELSKWISSDPLGYKAALSMLNQEQNGKIIPLIKMFKHWRDIQMKYRRPKSYWLECMVYKHAKANALKVENASYGELFLSLLTAVYDAYIAVWEREDAVPTIKDPMLGNNVAKSWTRAEFETFMRRIEESMKIAQRALNTDDQETAVELWQRLFNDDSDDEYFPTTISETLKALAMGSSLFVSESGKVHSQPSTTERSWQSPTHRFFGKDHETS